METKITSVTRWASILPLIAALAAGAGLWSCTAEFETQCPEGTVQTAGGGDVGDACARINQGGAGAGGESNVAGASGTAGGTQGSAGVNTSGAAGQMVAQPPGTLDAQFGQGGKVRTPLQVVGESIFEINIVGAKFQSTGKLIVAGTVRFSGYVDPPFLARFNEDGSLDSTFGGGGGYVIYYLPAHVLTEGIAAFDVLPDDKIIALGHVRSPYEDFYAMQLVRFNADGSNDDTFESVPVEPDLDEPTIFQAGGNGFFVAGNHKRSNDIYLPPTYFYMLRFDSSGARDNSFSPVELKGQSGGLAKSGSVAFDSQGRFVVAMLQETMEFQPKKFVALARFSSTGVLDPSFGGQGTGYHFENFGTGRLGDLSVDKDGKIVVVGTIFQNEKDGAFVRYLADGSLLDNSFGVSGLVAGAPLGKEVDDWACSVTLDDGKISAAGHHLKSSDNGVNFYSSTAVRLLQDGKFDTQYGGQKDGATSIGEGTVVKACLLDAAGRMVVVGHSYLNGVSSIDVVRVIN